MGEGCENIEKSKMAQIQARSSGIGCWMMSLSGAVYADDPIKRLLDLQLRKGIITQQEYDEFMSATGEDSPATVETGKEVETGNRPTCRTIQQARIARQ